MAARKPGLGRGLGALIPTEAADPGGDGPRLHEVPIASIEPNRFQPREHFDEESLTSLTASIRELGVLQPVLVRPGAEDGQYELIAGERRWRAAKLAGLTTIPAIIRSIEDLTSLEQAVVENLHRDDLNALEEAAAYQQLMEDFGLTQEQLAQRVGKSRPAVANTLRLLQLTPAVQKLIADNSITAGHARALLSTPDRAFQEALAKRAATEGLSVREVEEAVRARNQDPEPGAEPAPAKRQSALRPAGLLELEDLLERHLDTNVSVSMGARKGQVVIQFATLEDLERIYRLMIPTSPAEELSTRE